MSFQKNAKLSALFLFNKRGQISQKKHLQNCGDIANAPFKSKRVFMVKLVNRIYFLHKFTNIIIRIF